MKFSSRVPLNLIPNAEKMELSPHSCPAVYNIITKQRNQKKTFVSFPQSSFHVLGALSLFIFFSTSSLLALFLIPLFISSLHLSLFSIISILLSHKVCGHLAKTYIERADPSEKIQKQFSCMEIEKKYFKFSLVRRNLSKTCSNIPITNIIMVNYLVTSRNFRCSKRTVIL